MTPFDPPPSEPVFHLAVAETWAAAQAQQRWPWSTNGRTQADEGFVHLCLDEQLAGVRIRWFAGLHVVELRVDVARCPPAWRLEAASVNGDERFWHLYAELPFAALHPR